MDDTYELELAADRVPAVIQQATHELTEIGQQISLAKENAKNALEKAEQAVNVRTNWVFNKESINLLKETSYELAKSIDQSVKAQVKTQEYQKVLTQYTTEILKLTLLGPATCDRALKELREITSPYKNGKKLDDETKKQISSLIEQIQNQQSVINKVDALKESVRRQQDQIKDLLVKIDNLSSFDTDVELSDESIIVLNLLKTRLNDMVNILRENNDIICREFAEINNTIFEQMNELKGFVGNKYNELSGFIDYQISELKRLVGDITNLIPHIVSVIENKANEINNNLQLLQTSVENLSKDTKKAFEEIKTREEQNNKSLFKFKLSIYISIGFDQFSPSFE